MSKNRRYPYGYTMKDGEIIAELGEQTVVREIYRRYGNGESYKKIADSLTRKGVRYFPTKPKWNKNMIARILESNIYHGCEQYPAIIERADKEKVMQNMKTYTSTMSKEIKHIKPLLHCKTCGGKIARRIYRAGTETWVCPSDSNHISKELTDAIITKSVIELIINQLSKHSPKASAKAISMEVVELQGSIEKELNIGVFDIPKMHADIIRLAELKYQQCENTQQTFIHTIKLILDNPYENLNELKNICNKIMIDGLTITELVLTDKSIIHKGGDDSG